MEKNQHIHMSFAEDWVEGVDVTSLGENLYRLEVTPVTAEMKAARGDTIEAEMQENGVLRFLRVAETSWHHWDWLLPKDVIESAEFESFLEALVENGGQWERVFGGVIFVHLPEGSRFDPQAELQQVLAKIRSDWAFRNTLEDHTGGFITGVLVEYKNATTSEGGVHNRFLKLRLPVGQVLSIFDKFELISTGLETEQTHTVILIPVKVAASYYAIDPPGVTIGLWQGTVIDPHWKASEGSYQRVRPELYHREWLRLATPLGHLLMSPEDIEVPVEVGGIIQWRNLRLDLWAVV